MEERDNIKDLFRDKLSQHEAPVNPELWSSISAQIGNSAAAAATTGLSMISKILIGAAVVAAVTVTAVVLVNTQEEASKKQQPSVKQSSERSQSTISEGNNDVSVPASKNKTNENLLTAEEEQHTYLNTNEDVIDVYIPPVVKNEEDHTVVHDKKGGVENTTHEDKGDNDPSPIAKEDDVTKVPTQHEKDKPKELNIDLPNTFTPNGDGINDELFIADLEEFDLTDFNLIVLNASNKTVFQTTEIAFRWNGVSMNGDLVPSGNYIYYFTAKDALGNPITKYSRLTITR